MNYTDITDSAKDQEQLKGDKATLDLPGVEDIPGQENFRPLPLGELADTTISSDDEEGKGLLDDDGQESDVTDLEIELLRKSADEMPDTDDQLLDDIALDDKDLEGELLSEKSVNRNFSGSDLDVPGGELDDDDEEIGEEDEENNVYSKSDNQ